MAAPEFDDVELSRVVSRGVVGGTEKPTRFLLMPSGSEARTKLWAASRRHWQIEYEARSQAEAEDLRAFWECRDGCTRAFRFYDWIEHAVSNEVLAPTGAPTVQLTKTVTSGGQTRVKTIYAPISGTVTLRKNSANLVGWTLDYATGLVTLPLVLSKAITGITAGSTTLIQFGSAHSFVVGDKIAVTGVSGMTQINGLVGTVDIINVPANSIRITINSSSFGAWTSGGTAAKYVATADVLDWTGEFNHLARFDMSDQQITQEDVGVRSWASVQLIEVVA